MKKRSALVCVLLFAGLVLAWPAHAQEATWIVADDATHERGQIQYASPVYDCEPAVTRTLPTWRVPVDLVIEHVMVWMGTDAAAPGQPYPAVDAYLSVYASRPRGFLLAFLGLDRYAAPNAPHAKDAPRTHRLLAGDHIGGGFNCAALFGAVSHVQVLVVVDYVKTTP